MATIQELTAQVDQLQTDLDNEQEQIRAAIDRLNITITDMRVLISSGGTEAERQALSDKLTAISEDLKATIPDA